MYSESDLNGQAGMDDITELETFWCPKCKVKMELPTGSDTHILHWKNGITWYRTEHRVVRIAK